MQKRNKKNQGQPEWLRLPLIAGQAVCPAIATVPVYFLYSSKLHNPCWWFYGIPPVQFLKYGIFPFPGRLK